MFRDCHVSGSPNRKTSLFLLLAVTLLYARATSAGAQDAATPDDRIKALEHERDELKKRNSLLELRLRQLQASIDRTVTETLDTATLDRTNTVPPVPHPPGEPAAKEIPVVAPFGSLPAVSWRTLGPSYSRFAGIFSPLQQPLDLVSLAVAYQDALGELRRACAAKEFLPNRASDVDSALEKVRLLRSMTKTMRDSMSDAVDRMHKLDSVHAVPTMDVRNLEAKLQILDLILSRDPEVAAAPNRVAKRCTDRQELELSADRRQSGIDEVTRHRSNHVAKGRIAANHASVAFLSVASVRPSRDLRATGAWGSGPADLCERAGSRWPKNFPNRR